MQATIKALEIDGQAQRCYHLSERATAPLAIAATRQFNGFCPSSAAFMRKRL
ncbi:hypothetical protein PH586_21710 [Pseudomonas sp. SA3-5]|uniref:Uncharacterized protein n=1 Tax=Pseudomonas aestuarii TaxID=3018340 RepID=A0ABT4XLE6_9PSED|nr:hypothetical protein [Pseudomonas aestuarii]MDA7089000.1 hypothetical protein [Pseudomonas aestuarii]